MSRLLFTSDTHFGHNNIIRYCSRPFANITDMNEELIARWNDRVNKGDTVYHLGDFFFMNQEEAMEVLERLNGRIVIVPGNHDKVIHKLWQSPDYLGLTSLPFKLEQPILELHHLNKMLVMCHFPIESWHQKERGSIHLHGHSHGNATAMQNRYDVGVDVYGGPVELTELENKRGWL